jgi:hypothetical protein
MIAATNGREWRMHKPYIEGARVQSWFSPIESGWRRGQMIGIGKERVTVDSEEGGGVSSQEKSKKGVGFGEKWGQRGSSDMGWVESPKRETEKMGDGERLKKRAMGWVSLERRGNVERGKKSKREKGRGETERHREREKDLTDINGEF